jgi:hypothetical protein
MRLWPFTNLWTRWRADRRDRALTASWAADAAEQAAARRRILNAAAHHYDTDQPRPTRVPTSGPFLPDGQRPDYQHRSGFPQ